MGPASMTPSFMSVERQADLFECPDAAREEDVEAGDLEPALAGLAAACLEGLVIVGALIGLLVQRLDVAGADQQAEPVRGLGDLEHGARSAAGEDADVAAEQALQVGQQALDLEARIASSSGLMDP